VSAFGLSINNKWRWWTWSGGVTVEVDRLCLTVGGHLVLSLHSSYEPGELSYNEYTIPVDSDSTINTIVAL